MPNTAYALCSVSNLGPLGSSDHSAALVKILYECKESPDVPFHRAIYWYARADWDGFRSSILELRIDSIIRHPTSIIASPISDWIKARIDTLISSKTFQQRHNSPPWYIPECAAAIANCNQYLNLYHRNRSVESLAAF